MICTECSKIIEFFSAELEALQDAMAAKFKFEPTQHSLRIFGVCVECRRVARERKKAEGAAQPRVRLATAGEK
jgi:Fur family ferric uptake transcriptional regulator